MCLRRIRLSITFLLCLSAAAAAQLNGPSSGSEPFSLTSGSSFAASTRPIVSRSGLTTSLRAALDSLAEAESLIADQYAGSRSAQDLTSASISGMLRVLDPHSAFYDERDWSDLLDEQESRYSGIGISLASFHSGGQLRTYVISVDPGSPAAAGGFAFGDLVTAVNGVSMLGHSSDDVGEAIRGPHGTVVVVEVRRAIDERPYSLTIKRARLASSSLSDHFLIGPGGVGYIGLTNGFTQTTYSDVDAAIADLKRQGARSILLDLRNNRGGLVDQAVKVAERFLPFGTAIVSQRGRTAMDNRDWRSTARQPEQMPLVVLVNGHTASASEILAAALQDNDRALIVGERTFGKGLVQSVLDLPEHTGMTLTTARYLTPSGRSLQRDYSSGDLYDYYNHRSPASAIDQPFIETRSTTGRKLLGNDGILPDELVPDPSKDPLTSDKSEAAFFSARAGSVDERQDLVYKYWKVLARDGAAAAQRLLLINDPQVTRAARLMASAADLYSKARQIRSK